VRRILEKKESARAQMKWCFGEDSSPEGSIDTLWAGGGYEDELRGHQRSGVRGPWVLRA
jgi:hypothetical protein